MKWLVKHAKNIKVPGEPKSGSQGGEDGYIKFILDTLGIKGGWCMEIGAWDGIFLSNTFRLVAEGYHSIMVEGDPKRYEALEKTAEKYKGIVPVQCMVTPTNIADAVYSSMPDHVDSDIGYAVLSLDVDGTEAKLWEALDEGCNFGFVVTVVEWSDRGNRHPFTVLLQAEKLGYRPVAATNSNIIFVREDMYFKLCKKLAESEDA